MNDWNPKNISSRSQRPPVRIPCRCAGSAVAELLAVEIKKLQLRTGVLLVLREELAAEDGRALQYGVALRDDFLPVLAFVLPASATKTRIARRVFVGGDVDLAVVNSPP